MCGVVSRDRVGDGPHLLRLAHKYPHINQLSADITSSLQRQPHGEMVIEQVPLLSAQSGTSPDLVLRWNDMSLPPSELDLVLHLHGYSPRAGQMNLWSEKVAISGVDFSDPDATESKTDGRVRPTLGIIPRGRFFGGRSGSGYDFPVLKEPAICRLVIDDAVERFAATTGAPAPPISRRILTAHSGGGAALMPVAIGFAPHEIHVFDALYAETSQLADWAAGFIARDAAALRGAATSDTGDYMASHGHALRVAYIADTGTDPTSRTLKTAIDAAIEREGPAGDLIRPWYRVEPVTLDHALMPRTLGWRWLANAACDLPVGAAA